MEIYNEPDIDLVDHKTYINSMYEIIANRYMKWCSQDDESDYKTWLKQWNQSNYQWNPELSLKNNLINYVSSNDFKHCNIPLDIRYQVNIRKHIINLMPFYDPFSTLGPFKYDLSIIGDDEKENKYQQRFHHNGLVLLRLDHVWDNDHEFEFYLDELRESIMSLTYYKYHLIECKQIKPKKRLMNVTLKNYSIDMIKDALRVVAEDYENEKNDKINK
jgi:hypothetical protein